MQNKWSRNSRFAVYIQPDDGSLVGNLVLQLYIHKENLNSPFVDGIGIF